MSMLLTAVLAALRDNVTTVLLIAPVILLIAEELHITPYPFLFAEILFQIVGGTATLIGDPPNIMIGSAVDLSFNDFLLNLGPVIMLILLVMMVPFYLLWGRSTKASAHDRQRVLNFNENEAITDVGLLLKSLAVLALVLLGFVIGHQYHIQPASIVICQAPHYCYYWIT